MYVYVNTVYYKYDLTYYVFESLQFQIKSKCIVYCKCFNLFLIIISSAISQKSIYIYIYILQSAF